MNADKVHTHFAYTADAHTTEPVTASASDRPLLQALIFTLLLACALSLPTSAGAAIYKCVDSSGNTTYTGSPCAQDESTRRISKTATAVPGLNCQIARKYAFETTNRMKNGESSEQVFDSYGGINSQSPFVIGLTSYIFSFDGNAAASASRITTLATERCQVGSFGTQTATCDTYPYEFIEKLGGCDAALDRNGSNSHSPEATASPLDSATQTAMLETDLPKTYTPPELGKATAAVQHNGWTGANSQTRPSGMNGINGLDSDASGGEQNSCQSRIGQSLAETARQMQASQSVAGQEQLRERMRQLKKQLGRC